MAYLDSSWKIVSNKKQVISKKALAKIIKVKWQSFYYIWKTKATWPRIVLYEWKILSEPDEYWMVHTEYLDRNLKKNPDKVIVKRELPLKFLTIE